MDNSNEIRNIPIDQLHPHPQNPRKNLGDLSELRDSIKASGIYQNLTVVPGTLSPLLGREICAGSFHGTKTTLKKLGKQRRRRQAKTHLRQQRKREVKCWNLNIEKSLLPQSRMSVVFVEGISKREKSTYIEQENMTDISSPNISILTAKKSSTSIVVTWIANIVTMILQNGGFMQNARTAKNIGKNPVMKIVSFLMAVLATN